ncbi:MAG: RelA/SpoT domain-containing protein [Candidatus Vecturithrix sp.]|nr:RelA/SpoT domain-containing protein [Candidatus Vecturithrix sp.]
MLSVTMESIPQKLEEFKQQYQEKRQLYETFALRLQELLKELTQGANIPCDKIVYRVKALESFLDKIERKTYTAPFEQIKDLAGVRVVTYYLDDVERVRQLIYQEFTVDEQHSVDKIMRLGPEEFGYRSVHLIIAVSEPRVNLHEWSPFAGLTAEIQIRTILQHAWADLSHKIDYKLTSQAPLELRRRLFRLSALMELADEEFTALRDQAEHIVSGYKRQMSQDELEIPINLDSLREFIEQKVELQQWEAFGVRAGMEPFPQLISRYHAIGLQILLLTLQTVEITTIAEFEGLFEQFEKQHEQLKNFVDLVKTKGGSVHAVPMDVLILLTSIVKARQIPADFHWGGKYEDFYIDALQDVLSYERKTT